MPGACCARPQPPDLIVAGGRARQVYGTKGTAIILEPFEPGDDGIKLTLDEARGGYEEGEQIVHTAAESRQETYDLELEALCKVIGGGGEADRPLSHELLVQETLLRMTGALEEEGGPQSRL